MLVAHKMQHHQKGLTLIELLVVLVILAVLALAVNFVILPTVMSRVRDMIRLSDLDILSRALANYSTDKGFYPPSTTQGMSAWTCAMTVSSYSDCLLLQQELAPYLSKPVFEPLDRVVIGGNTDCTSSPCYMYGTSSKDHIAYCICTKLEGIPPQTKSNFCTDLVPYGNYCLTNTSN